ncbi:hypothetical protein L210DRAFT_949876 [Boletus edulis BED1]|uniref:Uncharacterized protein n=1 Tax=Boletus edulis BED1 TaxID=1328754 RepID=A0AAD4GLC3_BOLED|nr:hypothetical protein L210DRAFT_949876 [Boletus edulis BED1]
MCGRGQVWSSWWIIHGWYKYYDKDATNHAILLNSVSISSALVIDPREYSVRQAVAQHV